MTAITLTPLKEKKNQNGQTQSIKNCFSTNKKKRRGIKIDSLECVIHKSIQSRKKRQNKQTRANGDSKNEGLDFFFALCLVY